MKTATPAWCGSGLYKSWLLLGLVITFHNGRAEAPYEPGKSCFGRSNYVEYIAGDMPLIISAPHGGTLRPAEIPDRKKGEFTSDAYTEELARTTQQALHNFFGHYPHGADFARALARVFDSFFTCYYGLDLKTGAAFGSK
jgi:hypothetical protein